MVKRKRRGVNMPMSGAGLVRYMDQEGYGMKFKPEHIIYGAVGIVVLEIILKLQLI